MFIDYNNNFYQKYYKIFSLFIFFILKLNFLIANIKITKSKFQI